MLKASTLLILFIPILILVGNIYGIDDNAAYREEKTITETVININSTQIVADFKYFNDCLVDIKYTTGCTFEIITDKPSEISGFLSNGGYFYCVEKVSAEKGVYVHGWYTLNNYSQSIN